MTKKPKDIFLKFLQQYFDAKLLHGQSFYALNSRAILYFRYSKQHGGKSYFFGVESDDLARFATNNTFILFICGDEKKVIVLPVEDFMNMAGDTEPISNQWKIFITEKKDSWFLRVPRKGQFDVSAFINFFDFTQRDLRRSQVPEVTEFIPLRKKKIEMKKEILSPESEDLTQELIKSVRDSTNYIVFEKNVARALNELGLEAERIGGPDRTDVFVKSPFKAIVECKTSVSGSLSQVNFTRMKRHKKKVDAEFAAIASERFDPAVIEDAITEGVALIQTNLLAELLSLSLQFPLGAEYIRLIFASKGLPAEDVIDHIRSYVVTMGLMSQELVSVLGVLDAEDRSIDEIKGRFEGKEGKRCRTDDLRAMLEFLSNPILEIVGKGEIGYHLKLPLFLTKRRIKAVLSGFK